MEVNEDDLKVLHTALDEWQGDGMLTNEQVIALRSSIVLKKNTRQQIAHYFFFIALFCTLLAFGALFLSEKLLEKIKTYFAWSDLVIAGITAVLSVVWFWFIGKKSTNKYKGSYEVYMALGGLSVLTSLVYICKYINVDSTYALFFALATVVLASISVYMGAGILWVGAVISITCWLEEFTTYYQHNYLFWGMNYPVRYVALGAALLLLAYGQGFVKQLVYARRITYVLGLAVFFTALWAMSVFGNYNSLEHWQQVRQVHVLAYAILFGLAAALTFYLGVKYRDNTARDFGVFFLLINLYTRYFEYFWDTLNKGLFFLILAITFGLLGRWLERKSKAGIKKLPDSKP